MSVNPVLAALVGLVILDQSLQGTEWLAIAAIVTANTVSILTAGRHHGPAYLTLGAGVEDHAEQGAELVVGDGGGVLGSEPDGPLARLELGVAGGEAAVAALAASRRSTRRASTTPRYRRLRPTL